MAPWMARLTVTVAARGATRRLDEAFRHLGFRSSWKIVPKSQTVQAADFSGSANWQTLVGRECFAKFCKLYVAEKLSFAPCQEFDLTVFQDATIIACTSLLWRVDKPCN